MSSISLKPKVLVENPDELTVEEGHFSKTMMYVAVGFLTCLFISPLFLAPSWFALIFVLCALFFLVFLPLSLVLFFSGYREVTIRPGEYLESIYHRDLGGKKARRIPWSELESVTCIHQPSIEPHRDRRGRRWTLPRLTIEVCRVNDDPFVALSSEYESLVVDKVARYAGDKYSCRTERPVYESPWRTISRYFERLTGEGGSRRKRR